ncbi:MAG: hypothetical protein IPN75_19940 [Dechloromonas sp.]|uniref:Uncharacterized protein n=1 Tax=Candidatus Dechloromonas phosphorivorans TaxID=2899244 RepID=A0A9D7LR54_9RHOO|nr:hypothetical protein [Candidatus Dechloromonas phosphorivorans]
MTTLARHTLDDDAPANGVATLTVELATIVRIACRSSLASGSTPTFDILGRPNATQQQAIELLRQIKV